MTIMRIGQIVALSSALVLAPNCVAQLANYTTIDYPGATVTSAFGINDSGDIVGSYKDTLGIEHGFRLSKGVFTPIDYPGAKITAAKSINSQGDVAGYYSYDGSIQHGFVQTGGVFSTVDVTDATMTGPFGINPRGEVVGHTQFAGTKMVGFLLRRGQYTTLDYPAENGMSCAFAISANGTIAGHYSDRATGKISGWFMRGGEFTSFDVPGARHTMNDTGGINAAGDIVGPYVAGDGSAGGFVRTKDGVFLSITIPGSTKTTVRGINDRDQIVGVYVDSGKVQHGYVANLE
jgi:uncharacterized membrane protein